MSSRHLTIIFVSLATMSVLALVYNWAFVEYYKPEPGTRNAYERPSDGKDLIESRAPELLPLFPDPNDWRRTSASLFIPNDRKTFFLFKGEAELSPDQKTVGLNACSIVFLDERAPGVSEEEWVEHALVFESVEKIELTFVDPIVDIVKQASSAAAAYDVSKFDFGRMRGEVVLRAKIGDADVLFRTRDVVFNATQIHTNFDVSFHIGPNSGAGKGLTIDLETPLPLSSNSKKSFAQEKNVAAASGNPDDPHAKIDELAAKGNLGLGVSLKGIHLNELDGCLKFYGDSFKTIMGAVDESDSDSVSEEDAAQSQDGELLDEESVENVYVEARCKGGLYFSTNSNVVGGWCVRFNRDVEIVGYRDGYRTNQLFCDTLYFYLQDANLSEFVEQHEEVRDALARKRVTGALQRLVPTTVRALRGEDGPVIARDFQTNMQLEADEIRYDMLDHVVDLASSEEGLVRITQSTPKSDLDFTSKHIQTQLNALGEIESVVAGQRGRLQANILDEDGAIQPVMATWEEGLFAAPTPERDGYLKVTSSGAVSFVADGMGSFFAEEGDFWCRLGQTPEQNRPDAEKEARPPSFSVKALEEMKPILVDFRKNVALDSQRVKANIADSVAVRFESIQEEQGALNSGEGALGKFVDEKTGEASALSQLTDADDPTVFQIGANKLEIRCLLRFREGRNGPDVEATQLTLFGDVSLFEKEPESELDTMEIRADAVQIDNPMKKDAIKLRLLGAPSKPAAFRTEKLALNGHDVTIDVQQNFFQVLGQGVLKMTAPVDVKASQHSDFGQFISDAPIIVDWSDSMQFDGLKLRFLSQNDKYVVVAQDKQRLSSPEVALTLKNPLSIFDFDINNKEKLDVSTIDCVGAPGRLVNIEVLAPPKPDAVDRREAFYRAFVKNLSYSVASGEFVATGGGELRATIPSSGGSTSSLAPNASEPSAQEPSSAPKEPQWTKVHARFQGDVVGSVTNQEGSIANGVHAVFATVADPDAALDVNSPDRRPEGASYIEGDEAYMRVFKNVGAEEGQDVELTVRKNVLFKQKDITGLCDSLSYASKKNLVVLSGSNSNKAAIYRQKFQGAQRETLAEFTRATYQLDTQKVSVESMTHND